MQPEKNSSFGWLIWGVVTIAVAAIGLFSTNPDLACEILEIGCTTNSISGTYKLDNMSERIVFVQEQSNNRYAIGEDTSPWPWHGTITLTGDQFSGSGKFNKTGVQITLTGYVSSDRRIYIEYQFVGEDRVDQHWLYPRL